MPAQEKKSPTNLTGKKAEKLFSEGKVKSLGTGGRGIYFSVEGDTGTRQVSFEPAKSKWNCDCKYISLYPGRECSHILACKIFQKAPKA